MAFRLEIFEDPFEVFSNWNSLYEDPCLWSGISCSPNRDHVTKMLDMASLPFKVPNSFLELSQAYVLALFFYSNISYSAIKGFLPRDLGQLSFLDEL